MPFIFTAISKLEKKQQKLKIFSIHKSLRKITYYVQL